MVMKVYIANTMVEFVHSDFFQWKHLQRRNSVNPRSAIVNKPSEFLPPAPDNSMQRQNTKILTYIDNNNLYQGLKQTKAIIIPIKRNLRPSKDNKTFIEQQPAPSPTVIKTSCIFWCLGRVLWINILEP